MPIDPRIAMGYQAPQIESPLNAFAKYQQIQNAQQEQQMNALRMQEAQAAQEERNALRQLNPSSSDYENQLFKVNPQLGIAYKKEQTAAKTSEAALQKTQAEVVDSKLKQSRQFLDQIDPTDPNAGNKFIAWHEANHADSILGPILAQRGITADQSRARIEQAISAGPAEFSKLLVQSKLGTEKFMQMTAPKPQEVKRADGSIIFLDANPNSPTFKQEVMPSQATGMTPAEIQRLANEQVRIGFEGQRVGLEGRKVGLAEQQQAQKTDVNISPKEMQKREAVFPQATSSVKAFDAKTDSFIKDLEQLKNHPGLNQITGLVAGRVPAITGDGRAAQALYDKVVAKSGFQALQDLREASKTGGALGNVSNQEGKQLTASFAAIDRKQDAANVREAIDRAIEDIQGSKARMREAYDMTYGYKNLTPAQSEIPLPSAGGAKPTSPGPKSPLPPKPVGGVKFLGFE